MAVRKPSVAGTFYPDDKLGLQSFFEDNFERVKCVQKAKAIILPHAGYIYSGRTACKVLSRVELPKDIFLLGPNHRGVGAPFSSYCNGEWGTPLGNVPINFELATAITKSCPKITEDEFAHQHEHSLEVEVPLLLHKNPNLSLAPLIVGTLDLEDAAEVARCCGEVLSKIQSPFMTVVSTDMNHYENDQLTQIKDQYAIDAILNLDEGALVNAVKKHQISMCGFVPTYMLLMMKDFLGLKRAQLVEYTTSGRVNGDYERVVGYAGIIFEG